jgi:hypothetical protein
VSFWNHIGINWYAELLIEVHVNYVVGVDTAFTKEIFIDTSFISGGIPYIEGEVAPILDGIDTISINLSTTFIPVDDSLKVIIDLYNFIHFSQFLEKVLEHFGLEQLPPLIQFYPDADTCWMLGGCVGPEIVSHQITDATEKDSITIEPGSGTYFFYYDSLGNQIPVDKYYFTVIDSLNEYEYELWYYPKTWPPFDPIQIVFDSTFYINQNAFDIQLFVKLNDVPVDSFVQSFRADWGLGVEENGELPESYILHQNFPNPFNPTTKIKYALSNRQYATLKVYDILGNEVVTLVDEELTAGEYEVEFNPASGIQHPASGIYFYQLRAGDPSSGSGQSFVETKKMILLK